jgi:hypothetical protein
VYVRVCARARVGWRFACAWSKRIPRIEGCLARMAASSVPVPPPTSTTTLAVPARVLGEAVLTDRKNQSSFEANQAWMHTAHVQI